MNSDQRFSTLFSIVMILATAMLGWVSLKDGASPRVADNRSSAAVPADEQDVVARLWEDPLQAEQPEATKKHDADASSRQNTPSRPWPSQSRRPWRSVRGASV